MQVQALEKLGAKWTLINFLGVNPLLSEAKINFQAHYADCFNTTFVNSVCIYNAIIELIYTDSDSELSKYNKITLP